MIKHCPHPTGESTLTPTGGVENYRCCWCGVVWARAWRKFPHGDPAHGPYQPPKFTREWLTDPAHPPCTVRGTPMVTG